MDNKRYIVELSGVSWDERGYLKLGRHVTGAGVSKWAGLSRATKFLTESAAVESFKQSGLDGPGALIKTDIWLKEWSTQYTI
jgi:hypothetical protein